MCRKAILDPSHVLNPERASNRFDGHHTVKLARKAAAAFVAASICIPRLSLEGSCRSSSSHWQTSCPFASETEIFRSSPNEAEGTLMALTPAWSSDLR